MMLETQVQQLQARNTALETQVQDLRIDLNRQTQQTQITWAIVETLLQACQQLQAQLQERPSLRQTEVALEQSEARYQAIVEQQTEVKQELNRQILRSQLFADLALKICQSLQLDEILQTTVAEIRALLHTDRVLIYRLLPDHSGVVLTEDTSPTEYSLLGQTFPAEVFPEEYHSLDCQGKIYAVEDIEQNPIPPYCNDFLRQIGVKAKLVVPIVSQQTLWGLLIAHQCQVPRQWSAFEIDFLKQLADQVGIALAQSQLLDALRESEERFRTMANSAPVLLWMADTEKRCFFVNQGWLDFTGRSLQQEMKDGWMESIHPEDRAACLHIYTTAFDARQPFTMEYRLRRADGAYRWVLDTGTPRVTTEGTFAGYIGSCMDISDRKQAEAEIRKALQKAEELNALKSRFVTTASHEFRTPLSTILSSADLLEFYAGKWPIEKQQEHIARIQNAAVYMTSLLDDVLVLEQTEAGKLRFEPALVDLVQFCQALVAELQFNDQQRHGVTFQTCQGQQCQETTCRISAAIDEKLLRQILGNLLSNALKYSPVGSTVQFALTCTPDRAIFEIKDQGIGIPATDQGHLFEPFHRGENVGTISGTGLGLAIVKRSVEAHRGEIAIVSQEGCGTTVTVSLPLQAEQGAMIQRVA